MSSAASSTTKTRLPGLDLLRGVAILLVLGRHGEVAPESSPALHKLTQAWFNGGWIGVDLFFVLSGFLVSGLIFAEHAKRGTFSPHLFVIRRGLRIYPVFFVFLALVILLRVLGDKHIDYGLFGIEAVFLQNYFVSHFSHTWSLAVEEHFYLLLPALLFLLLRVNQNSSHPFRSLPWIFAAIALTCLALRVQIAFRFPYNFFTHHIPTHLRVDSLFFGVLIAYWFHYHRDQFDRLLKDRKVALLTAGVACLVPAFLWDLEHPLMHSFGFTLLYIGSGLVLCPLLQVSPELARALPFRILSRIGVYSYSIYLLHPTLKNVVHQEVTPILNKVLVVNWHIESLLYYSSAILIGIGFSLLLEWPILRLRDRIFPSNTPGPTPGLERSPSPAPIGRAEVPKVEGSLPLVS